MSPEQVNADSNLSLATDVWSFGVILYELLVGEAPFQGTFLSVVKEILVKPLTFESEAIPREFRPFLSRCLNRDASQRVADASQAHEEFAQVCKALRQRLRHERNRDKWRPITE